MKLQRPNVQFLVMAPRGQVYERLREMRLDLFALLLREMSTEYVGNWARTEHQEMRTMYLYIRTEGQENTGRSTSKYGTGYP